MKCKKCGAEIAGGHLYCSSCGAEVQIVSAANVMEEEFFLDFQNRQMHSKKGEKDAGELYGPAAKVYRRQLHRARLLMAVSFVVMLVFAVGFSVEALRTPVAEDVYVAMVQALSQHDVTAAKSQLVQMEKLDAKQPSDALFWQAWLCGRENDTKGQQEYLEQILDADPENIYACRNMIALDIAQEDYDSLYAFSGQYADSPLAALFTDYLVEEPQIIAGQTLTITAAEGLNIYYTLDGASPVKNGILYYAPIALEAGTYTVSAVACNEEGYYSPVVTTMLTVEPQYQLSMPQVTPDSGSYASPQTIHIQVPQGCSAYYTWNGSTPTSSSKKYSGGISMPEGNNVLSVILVDVYGNTSSIQRMNYIYMP